MHDLTTSGLDTVDWFLSDEALTPIGGGERFSERVMRLPCFYLHMAIEEASPPPRTGRALVLGSCSNPTKLNDRVIATWSRILARLPDARLHLKYRGSYGERELVADLGRRFAAHGIDASRLQLDGRRTNRKNHLDTVGGFDIALDPFPFNGSTTTYEALWMGVPVVTLAGERFVGRVGVAMLERVGLSDLAAADEDAYVETVIRLAVDADRRRRLRKELRDRLKASPLLDAASYARSMEKAYRAMWRDWTERQKSTSAAS